MASRADHELLVRWNCQRDDKDWDKYLARMGNPPPHICKANVRCLAEAEKAEGGKWSACSRNCSHERISSSRWHCQCSWSYTRGETGKFFCSLSTGNPIEEEAFVRKG